MVISVIGLAIRDKVLYTQAKEYAKVLAANLFGFVLLRLRKNHAQSHRLTHVLRLARLGPNPRQRITKRKNITMEYGADFAKLSS